MRDYTIMTDSGCDIGAEDLIEWGVERVDLSFANEEEGITYTNRDMTPDEFYARMKSGIVFKTSSASPGMYSEKFTAELKKGNDILYIGLSTGISTTANSARIAANDLAEAFPQNKIIIIDSLCASTGLGLVVWLAVKKKAEGASLSENAAYVEETIPRMSHWFTVGDLQYLRRGGRVSAAAAVTATVLNIKPIMHMDDAGKLVPVSRVRGRKQAIRALADKCCQSTRFAENGIYAICGGDCREDELLLEQMIAEKSSHRAKFITDVGPLIGAHSGPGTLSVFFLDDKR